MSTPIQALTLFVVAIAGWVQRDQQAAIVYLLEENRVLKARLRGRRASARPRRSQSPVPPRLVSANFENASRILDFGSVRIFRHDGVVCRPTAIDSFPKSLRNGILIFL